MGSKGPQQFVNFGDVPEAEKQTPFFLVPSCMSWYFLGVLFDLLPLASCYFSYLQKKKGKRKERERKERKERKRNSGKLRTKRTNLHLL